MNRNALLATAIACVLSACATQPVGNETLDQARATVDAAVADSNVNQYATGDLKQAQDQLAIAEQAWTKHDTPATTQHAYLATQAARISQLHGAAKADDARVAASQAERDRIQLEARDRELRESQANNDALKAERDAARSDAAAEQQALDALKGQQSDRGLVITLGDVLFDTGRSDLRAGAAHELEPLVAYLHANPSRRLEIDGYTDSIGSDALNDALSQRRAQTVKDMLIAQGVAPDRIRTEGYGKRFPVASNESASGRLLNRRVEVIVAPTDNVDVSPRTANAR